MLVSIIIPVHKIHNYFKSCIESVLSQTHKDLEIILACNGELSIQDCHQFISIEDNRLIYLKTANGRHNARNEALRMAKGSWIQFLDYDDYLFPSKIEEQLDTLSKNSCPGLCISKWKKFNQKIDEHYSFPFQRLFDENQMDVNQLVQRLGESGGFIATASWLVSKELVNQVEWIDSPNDDAVFLTEILKKSPLIIMMPKVLAGYRMHESNTSSIRSRAEFDKLMSSWKIINNNLIFLNGRGVNLYIYKAYLYLIRYSKQINYYRFIEVVCFCILFGQRAKVGFLIFKDIKRNVIK